MNIQRTTSMNSSADCNPEEGFLEIMKAARGSSAVLKARLLALRSSLANVKIFAVEGDDDKIIYGQWLQRVRPDLCYEPFPCGGKKEARMLSNSLSKDVSGLKNDVVILVDRDYNDLDGFCDCDNVFMTEFYSAENYLVNEDVLEILLKDIFPCHALPGVRKEIISLFNSDYSNFLEITTDINRRIYIARKIPVEITRRLPKSLGQISSVELGKVTAINVSVEELIPYEREPLFNEIESLCASFSKLEPKTRYRGKFAIKFFMIWLDKLANEFSTWSLGLFGSVKPEGVVRRAELTLSTFASKSCIPSNFIQFVNRMA